MSKDDLNPSFEWRKFLLIGIFGIALTFTYFKTHDLVFGKAVTIDAPTNGQTLSQPLIVIRGTAIGSTILTVSGAKVIPDQEGRFVKEMVLGIGYNVIDIVSVDRFNRESHKRLELVYKPKGNSDETVALIKH